MLSAAANTTINAHNDNIIITSNTPAQVLLKKRNKPIFRIPFFSDADLSFFLRVIFIKINAVIVPMKPHQKKMPVTIVSTLFDSFSVPQNDIRISDIDIINNAVTKFISIVFFFSDVIFIPSPLIQLFLCCL